MVLDEPTNDLDMETLELLEELLLEYQGTLLIVSHDRRFLDNVITNCIVFEAPGVVKEYVGGYQDWLNQGGQMLSFLSEEREDATRPSASPAKPPSGDAQREQQKLQRQRQKELDQITRKIERTEADIAEIEATMAQSGFYERPQEEVQPTLDRLTELQREIENLYSRWEELESQA